MMVQEKYLVELWDSEDQFWAKEETHEDLQVAIFEAEKYFPHLRVSVVRVTTMWERAEEPKNVEV